MDAEELAVWMYLEAVFTSGELARQLPREAKRFQSIDVDSIELLQHVVHRRQARGQAGAALWQCSIFGGDSWIAPCRTRQSHNAPRAGGNERRNPNSIDAARTVI